MDAHALDGTSEHPPVPVKKTLMLVNSFVVQTTRFLNHFSSLAEEKLQGVHHNISRVEESLLMLESRLARMPELADIKAPPVADESEPVAPAVTGTAPATAAAVEASAGDAAAGVGAGAGAGAGTGTAEDTPASECPRVWPVSVRVHVCVRVRVCVLVALVRSQRRDQGACCRLALRTTVLSPQLCGAVVHPTPTTPSHSCFAVVCLFVSFFCCRFPLPWRGHQVPLCRLSLRPPLL